MVRLKQIRHQDFVENNFGLNSTMVRLKRFDEITIECEVCGSQFHYGSIKTSVKSRIQKSSLSLNSTMVRLKRICHSLKQKQGVCLNSTMVRLKHC